MDKIIQPDLLHYGRRGILKKILFPALFVLFLTLSLAVFNSGSNKVQAMATCGINSGSVTDYAGAVIYVRYHVSGSPTYYSSSGASVTVTSDSGSHVMRDSSVSTSGPFTALSSFTTPQSNYNCGNNASYGGQYPFPAVFAYNTAEGASINVNGFSGVLDCGALSGHNYSFTATGSGVPSGATGGGTWDSVDFTTSNGGTVVQLLTYSEPPQQVPPPVTISGLVATQASSGGGATPYSGAQVELYDQTIGTYTPAYTSGSSGVNYSFQVPSGDLYQVYMVNAPPSGFTGPYTWPSGQLAPPWYSCNNSVYNSQVAGNIPSTSPGSGCPSLSGDNAYNFLYTGSVVTTSSQCTGLTTSFSGSGTTYSASASYSLGTLDNYSNVIWNWGDGTSTSGGTNYGGLVVSGAHTYSSSGTFNVNATVIFTGGTSSPCPQTTVTISGSSSSSTCTSVTVSGTNPYTATVWYTLGAGQSYDNSLFQWGDGSSDYGGTLVGGFSLVSPSHTYTSPGTYQISTEMYFFYPPTATTYYVACPPTSVTVAPNITPACNDGTYQFTAPVSPSSAFIGEGSTATITLNTSGPFGPSTRIVVPAVPQLGIAGGQFTTGSVLTLSTQNVGTYSIPIQIIIYSTASGAQSPVTSACLTPITIRVAYQPYAKVYGGDVVAGSTFDSKNSSCTASATSANIIGWNVQNTFTGAGTEFAAFALGGIDGFATSQGTLGGAGLSFSNTANLSLPLTEYGGQFGQVSCIPDYYDKVVSSTATTLTGSTNLASLATGVYHGSSLSVYGTISTGTHIVIYVDDGSSVNITNNIAFAGTWNSISDIPSFELIVKQGNINVEYSVTRLEGLYVAQGVVVSGNQITGGKIYDCTVNNVPPGSTSQQFSSNCGNPLLIVGAFAATQIDLMRTTTPAGSVPSTNTLLQSASDPTSYSGGSVGNASEVFSYNPVVWLGLTNAISTGTGNSLILNGYNSITSLPPVL